MDQSNDVPLMFWIRGIPNGTIGIGIEIVVW